jgi:ribonuclease G
MLTQDVSSEKKRLADTVVKTNLEAVHEVARQLQLRNIGGVVVIDFIDMENTRDRIKVMNTLEAALKGDHTRTRIVQLSPLGLVEMTRRREGESLRQLLFNPCPYCDGDGVIKTPDYGGH